MLSEGMGSGSTGFEIVIQRAVQTKLITKETSQELKLAVLADYRNNCKHDQIQHKNRIG